MMKPRIKNTLFNHSYREAGVYLTFGAMPSMWQIHENQHCYYCRNTNNFKEEQPTI